MQRLALILSSYQLPSWQGWIVDELRRRQFAIPLVLVHSPARCKHTVSQLRFKLWRALDQMITERSAKRRDPLLSTDVRRPLADAEWVDSGECGQVLTADCREKLSN